MEHQEEINKKYANAREVLKYYFHVLRRSTDIRYDPDVDAELDSIVDSIQEAVELQIAVRMGGMKNG